jgi:hypothetical protein
MALAKVTDGHLEIQIETQDSKFPSNLDQMRVMSCELGETVLPQMDSLK